MFNFNLNFLKKAKDREHMAECGHLTKLKGDISGQGDTTEMTMKKDEDGKLSNCLECLGKMTIKCAWCGGAIFVSDVITLYSPREEGPAVSADGMVTIACTNGEISEKTSKNMPDYAVKYSSDSGAYVGCGRTTCADTGMDYAGHWMPPGKVIRMPTIMERMMSNPDAKYAMGNPSTGDVTIVEEEKE